MAMLRRRDFLLGGMMTSLGRLLRKAAPEKAAQPQTKVTFKIPAGACDCHVHVFGDPRQYAYAENRTYTPESASVDELRSLLSALHLDRVVVVQPSVYGTDNSCTLDGVRKLGMRARGVAVIDEKTPETTLDEMARDGIRGVRLNLATAGVTDPGAAQKRFQDAVERVRRRNWHVQLNTQLSVIEALSAELMASPVPLVFDHFGGARAATGVQQPGFSSLINLVNSGKAYVKISAAGDGMSSQGPDYPDVAPLAKALVAANPQRILWGSNWPHPDAAQVAGRKNTDIAPLMQTDDGRILNLLSTWVPEPATRRMILTENPARLYGF
jgi:predicted TIM-barrel fold metal-dependent hydrolase